MDMYTVSSLLALALVSLMIKQTDAVMCYTCDHVSHPRDCDRIMECKSGEFCFATLQVQPNGVPYYRSGCMPHPVCRTTSVLVGRRDISLCSQCCDTDFCNKELCDTPAPTQHGPRCLQCTSVEDPTHCGAVTECQLGQECYTQEKYVFGERRFQMGCATKGCFPLATYRSLLMARAAGLCLACCSGENCNRKLCNNTGTPLTQSPVTVPTVTPHHTTDTPVTQFPVTTPTHTTTHTTVVPLGHGCYYKGQVYQTGDHWDDGCLYTCSCIDSTVGRYVCHDRCPTFTSVPDNCQMVTPPGECCAVPHCSTNFTSSTLNNRCFYSGQSYSQGEKWRDGCTFECECLNAEQGQYRCTSLCYTWTLPSVCRMEDPAPGKCCKVPKCPAGFTIHYPPGYVEN